VIRKSDASWCGVRQGCIGQAHFHSYQKTPDVKKKSEPGCWVKACSHRTRRVASTCLDVNVTLVRKEELYGTYRHCRQDTPLSRILKSHDNLEHLMKRDETRVRAFETKRLRSGDPHGLSLFFHFFFKLQDKAFSCPILVHVRSNECPSSWYQTWNRVTFCDPVTQWSHRPGDPVDPLTQY